MRRLSLTALALMLPFSAIAQDRTVIVEPVPAGDIIATIDAPIEYDEKGIVKAQHFKAEDLTPEQYQALLEEAEKIRLYRQSRQADTSLQPIMTDPTISDAVPVVAAPIDTPATSSASTHTVQTGDTLYNIAQRHDVSVTELQQANGIQGSSISIGQSLVIPSAYPELQSKSKSVSSITETIRDGVVTRRIVEPIPEDRETRSVDDITTQTYAVLKKDTLFAISRRTCVDVESLIALNNLEDPNALTPGQQLDLPETHCLTR